MILDSNGNNMRRVAGFGLRVELIRDESTQGATSSSVLKGSPDTEWKGGQGNWRQDAYGKVVLHGGKGVP
jgi:hypothetical protein